VRVLKKFKTEKTEQILYGEELHKAAEEYVKGIPLPKQFEFIKGLLDALLSKTGAKHAEIQMAVRQDLTPCGWQADDVWVRGIADLLILDGPVAWVVDYKTGSNKYPDIGQLKLMSALVMQHYPEVQTVQSALIFVVKDSMTKHKVTRDEVGSIWWDYRERVSRIEASHANNVWNPKRSGLCPWCPVTSCEYHPKH
jgi:hypothetical protein